MALLGKTGVRGVIERVLVFLSRRFVAFRLVQASSAAPSGGICRSGWITRWFSAMRRQVLSRVSSSNWYLVGSNIRTP